jgi:hypothetical protein
MQSIKMEQGPISSKLIHFLSIVSLYLGFLRETRGYTPSAFKKELAGQFSGRQEFGENRSICTFCYP